MNGGAPGGRTSGAGKGGPEPLTQQPVGLGREPAAVQHVEAQVVSLQAAGVAVPMALDHELQPGAQPQRRVGARPHLHPQPGAADPSRAAEGQIQDPLPPQRHALERHGDHVVQLGRPHQHGDGVEVGAWPIRRARPWRGANQVAVD